MAARRGLLWCGAVAYVVAWFLPVIKGGTTLSEGGVPGWEALLIALSPLLPGDSIESNTVLGAILPTLSGLTNLLVPLAILQLATMQVGLRARRLGWALVVAAVVNTQWFVLSDARDDLRLGYYLWLASFVILAAAAFRISTEKALTAASPAGSDAVPP